MKPKQAFVKYSRHFVPLLATCLIAIGGCDSEDSFYSNHPDTYSAESIEGWVVDVTTNRPLEGVIVVAAWVLYGGEMPGLKFDQVGTLKLMESVTDKNGRYYFPAWGPVSRPNNSVLTGYDPQLSFFKSTYDVKILLNPFQSTISERSVRRSIWTGKSIAMTPFKGAAREYADQIRKLGDGPIEKALENCTWHSIPRTIAALRQENVRLERFGTRGVTVERILPTRGKEDVCGALDFWNSMTEQ